MTCPSTTSSTIKPKWTDPLANPGLRGDRPATNCLSYVTAKSCSFLEVCGERFTYGNGHYPVKHKQRKRWICHSYLNGHKTATF
jgi:hypothetical protein